MSSVMPELNFNFKQEDEHGTHDVHINALSSSRNVSAAETTPISTSTIPSTVMPMPMPTTSFHAPSGVNSGPQPALLHESEHVGEVPHPSNISALSQRKSDVLYAAPNGTLRSNTHEEGGALVGHSHVALTQAVVESLFEGTGRKKDSAVPTPTEFRAALVEMKKAACAKMRRQRNEARAEADRLQQALSALVGTRTSVRNRSSAHDDGDETEESGGGEPGSNVVNVSHREWSH